MIVESDGQHLKSESPIDKQNKLKDVLARIPEEPNLSLVIDIEKASEGSNGSPMLTTYMMREAAKGISCPFEKVMVGGQRIIIPSRFPDNLQDERGGIFGENAMQIERRVMSSFFYDSLEFETPEGAFLVRWQESFREHYGEEFVPIESRQ